MIKQILLVTATTLFSVSVYANEIACPQASETNSPTFCSTFKVAAGCHCLAQHMPAKVCADMGKIYDSMLTFFKTLQKACEFQHDTPTQTCIDDWNCYRLGGKDSKGRLCSNTAKACL